MKLWEALNLAEKWMKFRDVQWRENQFIQFVAGNLVDETGNNVCLRIFNSNHVYEVYEEIVQTYNFMEAVELMKKGKSVKRIHESFGDLAMEKGNAGFICYAIGQHFPLRIQDFEANDWILSP